MHRRVAFVPLCVLTALVALGLAPLKAQDLVTIWIGPQTRDGFIDMDEGIHDSINDLAKVLDDSVFRLVDEPDEATLTLLVRGRGYGGTFGVGGS